MTIELLDLWPQRALEQLLLEWGAIDEDWVSWESLLREGIGEGLGGVGMCLMLRVHWLVREAKCGYVGTKRTSFTLLRTVGTHDALEIVYEALWSVKNPEYLQGRQLGRNSSAVGTVPSLRHR